MELNKGEYICEKCEGTGKLPPMKSYVKPGIYETCDNCNGEGKLDWVENIVGKRFPLDEINSITNELTLEYHLKLNK